MPAYGELASVPSDVAALLDYARAPAQTVDEDAFAALAAVAEAAPAGVDGKHAHEPAVVAARRPPEPVAPWQ